MFASFDIGEVEKRLTSWSEAIAAVLGEGYKPLAKSYMGCTGLVAFIVLDFPLKVVEKDVVTVKTGGTKAIQLPNKGAVALSLNFGPNSQDLIFASCHLQAGGYNYVAHTDSKARLPDKPTDLEKKVGGRNAHLKKIVESLPDDNAALVLFGDLNFRINLPPDQIVKLLGTRACRTLYQHDQLAQALAAPHGLLGEEGLWREVVAPPPFLPTYRKFTARRVAKATAEAERQGLAWAAECPLGLNYDVADVLDPRPPAWCDRVLLRSRTPLPCTCLAYGAVERGGGPRLSDHVPVYALLRLGLRGIPRSSWASTKAALATGLPPASPTGVVRIRFPTKEVLFSDVSPDRPFTIRQQPVLENVGTAPLRWEVHQVPPWFTVRPSSGILLPQQKAFCKLTGSFENDLSPLDQLDTRHSTKLGVHAQKFRFLFQISCHSLAGAEIGSAHVSVKIDMQVDGKYDTVPITVLLDLLQRWVAVNRIDVTRAHLDYLAHCFNQAGVRFVGQVRDLPRDQWRAFHIPFQLELALSQILFVHDPTLMRNIDSLQPRERLRFESQSPPCLAPPARAATPTTPVLSPVRSPRAARAHSPPTSPPTTGRDARAVSPTQHAFGPRLRSTLRLLKRTDGWDGASVSPALPAHSNSPVDIIPSRRRPPSPFGHLMAPAHTASDCRLPQPGRTSPRPARKPRRPPRPLRRSVSQTELRSSSSSPSMTPTKTPPSLSAHLDLNTVDDPTTPLLQEADGKPFQKQNSHFSFFKPHPHGSQAS